MIHLSESHEGVKEMAVTLTTLLTSLWTWISILRWGPLPLYSKEEENLGLDGIWGRNMSLWVSHVIANLAWLTRCVLPRDGCMRNEWEVEIKREKTSFWDRTLSTPYPLRLFYTHQLWHNLLVSNSWRCLTMLFPCQHLGDFFNMSFWER